MPHLKMRSHTTLRTIIVIVITNFITLVLFCPAFAFLSVDASVARFESAVEALADFTMFIIFHSTTVTTIPCTTGHVVFVIASTITLQ